MDEYRRNEVAPGPIDPVAMARRDLKKALPRRFYADVTVALVDGSFVIHLDGKPVRTPAKTLLKVPTSVLAEALAAEWRAQKEIIDPAAMPMTRLVNSAIDGIAHHREATIAAVAKFAETDLLCYRASEPTALVEAQANAWDPILASVKETFGTHFICAEGIVFVEQPQVALADIMTAVQVIASGASGVFRLAALSVMTSLTGSVLIALAVAHDKLGVEDAWRAAHVDEDYQMSRWGVDREALLRREQRCSEMRAAATLYTMTSNLP